MRTQTGFLDGLTSAARDNPVAAALIGGGALWLLMDNDKLKGAVSFGGGRGFPDGRHRCAQSAVGRVRATADG